MIFLATISPLRILSVSNRWFTSGTVISTTAQTSTPSMSYHRIWFLCSVNTILCWRTLSMFVISRCQATFDKASQSSKSTHNRNILPKNLSIRVLITFITNRWKLLKNMIFVIFQMNNNNKCNIYQIFNIIMRTSSKAFQFSREICLIFSSIFGIGWLFSKVIFSM